MAFSMHSKVVMALLVAMFVLGTAVEDRGEPMIAHAAGSLASSVIYLPIILNCSDGNDNDDISSCARGPVRSGQIYTGCPDDVNDYYLFDLYVSGSISITLTNYRAVGQLVLRDIALNPIAYWPIPLIGGATVHVSDLVAPARYYLQIGTVASFNCANVYSLTATFPVPPIMITEPLGTVKCINPPTEAWCAFYIRGTANGVTPSSGLRIYTFVYPLNPSGEGWYIQKPSASIESDGDWIQGPAFLGDAQFPAHKDDKLWIRAALVRADATYQGKGLDDLQRAISRIEDINGWVALSNIEELIVQR